MKLLWDFEEIEERLEKELNALQPRRIKEYIHTTIEEILVIDGDFAMFTQLILAVKKRREYNCMAYLKQSHIYTMKYASR